MRFEAEHDFDASPARVAAVLCDPAFHTQLDLPDLSRPEIVEHTVSGTTSVLLLRYEYIGQLDAIARKVIGGRRLTWLQELRFDTSTFTGTLTFSAEEDAGRLTGDAQVAITEVANGDRARRRIAGDFRVRVPLVGGTAERRIVPGLVRRLDVEAEAVSLRLRPPAR